MFNEIAERVRIANSDEERKQLRTCAYIVMETGGAYEDAYTYTTLFLNREEAEDYALDRIRTNEAKYLENGYRLSLDTDYIWINEVHYDECEFTEIASWELNTDNLTFETME